MSFVPEETMLRSIRHPRPGYVAAKRDGAHLATDAHLPDGDSPFSADTSAPSRAAATFATCEPLRPTIDDSCWRASTPAVPRPLGEVARCDLELQPVHCLQAVRVVGEVKLGRCRTAPRARLVPARSVASCRRAGRFAALLGTDESPWTATATATANVAVEQRLLVRGVRTAMLALPVV